MAVSPRLVVADPDGQILDHPFLRMAGHSGPDVVAVPSEDLLRLPEGSKLFSMPGSQPVAWDPRQRTYRSVPRVQIGGRRFTCQTVAAFLPPGYTRTLLPAAAIATPPAAAAALVLHGRRLGWRGLRGGRPPDRSHGPFRRRALRRPGTAAPHEGAAQGARGQSDPRASSPAAPPNTTAWRPRTFFWAAGRRRSPSPIAATRPASVACRGSRPRPAPPPTTGFATRPPPTTWWRWRCRSSPRCPRPLSASARDARASRSSWPM